MQAIMQHHPIVSFSFFMIMVVICLASMHPVFQLVSFVVVVAYSVFVSGIRGFLKGSWWLVFVIAFVTLFNGLFGGRGLTVLFTLNLGFLQTQITVESLFYGLVMGLMLANVILWFNVFSKLSSEHGFIELFARVSPTVGLMLSRIMVFIPELLGQARMIDRAQRSFLPGDSDERGTRKGRLAYAGTLSSHLMEWGMEKSLITANSMLARGYGSRKRTSYRRTRLTARDAVALGAILALGILSLVCVIWAGAAYEFYPYIMAVEFWWGYIPFLLLCCVPLIMQLGEELAWWLSR